MPVRSTEFQGLAADTDTSGGPVADADRAERKQSRPPVYDAWWCSVQPNAEQPVARTSAASTAKQCAPDPSAPPPSRQPQGCLLPHVLDRP